MKKNRLYCWINNLKLKYKMILIIMLSCFILLVGNCISIQVNKRAYDELIYVKTAQIFTSFVEYVKLEFERLSIISLSVVGDNSIQENLIGLRDKSVGEIKWQEAKSDLDSSVRGYFSNVEYCSNFGIYTSDGISLGSVVEIPSATKVLLAELAQEYNGTPKIVRYGDNLYFVRQIRQRKNLTLDNLGTIIGTIDINKLFRECVRAYEKYDLNMNMTVYFDDILIYHTSQPIQMLEKDGWKIIGNELVVQRTTQDGWVYLQHTSYKEIFHTQRQIVLWTIVSNIMIALIATAISYIFIKRITHQFDKLILKFNAYGKGIMPSKEEMQYYQDRNDEIGGLHRIFDKMVFEYKEINDKNYNLMILQREAQFKQLQQQIQPHFIFNTLSHITWIAYEHKDTEIAEISNSLSRMLRNSMTFSKKTVLLSDELTLVKDYLLIQKHRFRNRICYEILVDPELEKIYIPQMTIQPIVENAIKYALEEELDTCIIRIIGKRNGEDAIFIVEDNGPGIDEDILEKLETQQVKAKGNGIGLLNIQKRLQVVFSAEYGISFKRVDGYTQVWIRIPIQKKGQE